MGRRQFDARARSLPTHAIQTPLTRPLRSLGSSTARRTAARRSRPSSSRKHRAMPHQHRRTRQNVKLATQHDAAARGDAHERQQRGSNGSATYSTPHVPAHPGGAARNPCTNFRSSTRATSARPKRGGDVGGITPCPGRASYHPCTTTYKLRCAQERPGATPKHGAQSPFFRFSDGRDPPPMPTMPPATPPLGSHAMPTQCTRLGNVCLSTCMGEGGTGMAWP